MKQLLVIAIALASTNAFASRARLNSMGNSPHIIDTQRIYMNPANMFSFGDFVNLESGKTATNTNPSLTNANDNAEGMIVRSMGDAKMGLSLGHKSANASGFGLRGILGVGDVTEQQNPIEISYGRKSGDWTWAGTVVYSNYNDKKNKVEESSMGVRLGALWGAWDFSAGIGAGNEVKDTLNDKEFEGTMGLSLFAGYNMNDLYTYGEVVLAGAEVTAISTGAKDEDVDQTKITVGTVHSIKKDGNEFFYGASLVSTNTKDKADDNKVTSLKLPVIVGLEAEAASWLTLRGSLTQTVLVNDSKDETGSTVNSETAPGTNNTVAAIGAGMKFNKVMIDGSLQGLTGGTADQQIDSDSLLTTVGLTYMF